MHSISNIYHYYIVEKSIFQNMLVCIYHFSFVAIESEMVDYKNHIGHDDIINKRVENDIIHYLFRGSKPKT